MKRYIVAIALFIAGTAFANAAIVYTTVNPAGATKAASFGAYGFAANFANADIGSTSAVGGDASSFAGLRNTYLNGITLYGRSDESTLGSGVSFKVAVYRYIGIENVGDFLALSNEAQTSVNGGSMDFTFDSIDLGVSNATYQFLFVRGDTTTGDLEMSGRGGFNSYTANGVGITSLRDPDKVNLLPNGWGTYKNNFLNQKEGAYIPKFELKTSDTPASVPEPSVFGLLAGIGALALVASRRRRARKAA